MFVAEPSVKNAGSWTDKAAPIIWQSW